VGFAVNPHSSHKHKKANFCCLHQIQQQKMSLYHAI